MPKVIVNNIDIHYKILGNGDPLLMIMGLSFSLRDWKPAFLDQLARQYQLILFDNRDAGESSRSPLPYSITQFAKDAVGLLDTLEIPKAHVFGVSTELLRLL